MSDQLTFATEYLDILKETNSRLREDNINIISRSHQMILVLFAMIGLIARNGSIMQIHNIPMLIGSATCILFYIRNCIVVKTHYINYDSKIWEVVGTAGSYEIIKTICAKMGDFILEAESNNRNMKSNYNFMLIGFIVVFITAIIMIGF